MAYKKPQIVAKSAAKASFVAGCPTEKYSSAKCSNTCEKCALPNNR